MRKKILVIATLCLMLCSFSCSKDKEKQAAETEQAVKTVDLGEAREEGRRRPRGKAGAQDAEAAADAKAVQVPAKRGRRDRAAAEDAAEIDDKVMVKRNDAAALNPDGSAKRGLSAEAKRAAEQDGVEELVAEETSEETAQAMEASFDFALEDDDSGELDEKTARPQRRPEQSAMDAFINMREFREQTGYAGLLVEAELLGQAEDARYQVMRLSTDDPKELGFSIQLWKPGNESAAVKRFDDLYAQSFGGTKVKGLASDAFLSTHHKLHELAFLDRDKRACVLLTCSSTLCSVEQLRTIAQLIMRRL